MEDVLKTHSSRKGEIAYKRLFSYAVVHIIWPVVKWQSESFYFFFLNAEWSLLLLSFAALFRFANFVRSLGFSCI